MPTAKELNIQLEHKPGTLAKLCKALADRKVNIVAFQASTDERRSQVHLIVDNAAAAKISTQALITYVFEQDKDQSKVIEGVVAGVAFRVGP